MTEHTEPVEAHTPNAYLLAVLGECGERHPDLVEAWDELHALLTEGTYTRHELMAMTGLGRSTVRALTFYGRKTGKLRITNVSREVEVAPDVWMLSSVRGFRATLTVRTTP